MATKCNYTDNPFPEMYKEIYCSQKGSNTKAFICKDGYKPKSGVTEPIILEHNKNSKKCNTIANQCQKVQQAVKKSTETKYSTTILKSNVKNNKNNNISCDVCHLNTTQRACVTLN